jgi:RNA polymerase sigma factor (sigma-70 family)
MTLYSESTQLDELLTHRSWVTNLARSLVSDRDLAEDITQEAWLAAMKNPPRPERAKAWFCQVLRNQAALVKRSRSSREQREQRVGESKASAAVEAAQERASMLQEVVEMTLQLDEPFREALLLRYIEELPPREIARQLGVPLNTITSRLQRGLEQLRQKLRRKHGEANWAGAVMVLVLRPAELRALRLGQLLTWSHGFFAVALLVSAWCVSSALGQLGVREPVLQQGPLVVSEASTRGLRPGFETALHETPGGRVALARGDDTIQDRVGLGDVESRDLWAHAGLGAEGAPRSAALEPHVDAFDARSGDLVVTSSGGGRERVLRISTDGSERTLASLGDGKYWVGNAVLPGGDLACAAVCGPTGNRTTVNIFDGESGELRHSFHAAEVFFPGDVAAFSDGTLALSDRNDAEVELYSLQGEHLSTLRYAQVGRIGAHGLCIDSNDELWVGDPEAGRVHRFDRSGRQLSSTRVGYFMSDIASAGDGTFWTLRSQHGLVERFDQSGRVLRSIQTHRGRLDGLAIAEDGSLWISSLNERSLLHLGAEGELLGSLEVPDGFQPEFMSVSERASSVRSFCEAERPTLGEARCALSGEGSQPSSSHGAGRLVARGSVSLQHAGLSLEARGLLAGDLVLLVVGSDICEPKVFGAEAWCLAGSLRELGVRRAGEGGVAIWNTEDLSAAELLPGMVYFQAIHRDLSAPRTAAGFGTTSGVAIELQP